MHSTSATALALEKLGQATRFASGAATPTELDRFLHPHQLRDDGRAALKLTREDEVESAEIVLARDEASLSLMGREHRTLVLFGGRLRIGGLASSEPLGASAAHDWAKLLPAQSEVEGPAGRAAHAAARPGSQRRTRHATSSASCSSTARPARTRWPVGGCWTGGRTTSPCVRSRWPVRSASVGRSRRSGDR